MLRFVRTSPLPQIPGASALLGGYALPERRWPERRVVVLTLAVVLFGALFALRMSTNDVKTGIGLLFVIPVGLIALELGVLAGVGAAALASALIAIWSHTKGAQLGWSGEVVRGFVFVAVGAISGRFSDRMRAWGVRQQRLLESGLVLAHLARPEDLPALVAARARAAVGAGGARVTLTDGGGAIDGTVGERAVRVAIEIRGESLGEIEVALTRALEPEDQRALAMLAVQAGVAIENARLLAAERQLGDARRRLDERADQLREVLAGQEDERRDVARRLHEDSAQEMAALLLRLRAIERTLESDVAREQVDAMREDAQAALARLRDLAVELRPPVLDLGLAEALQRLGERTPAELTVTLDGVASALSRDDETTVYRIVEDALDAFDEPHRAAVEAHDGELIVTVAADGARPRAERLMTIAARLELVGGELTGGDGLRVRIPLTRD